MNITPRLGFLVAGLMVPVTMSAQSGGLVGSAKGEVTFAKDIAPILQRSCQTCHRPNSIAPMSLIEYEEVRPWARSIKNRTGLRDKPGTMPPWFVEKDIGIQRFKNDPSLTDEEVATIAAWVDNGAPEGDPEDTPAPLEFLDADEWQIGEPDLVVSSPTVEVRGDAPDWWGTIGETPLGLTTDRYVAALEFKEVTESREGPGRGTVGGLFVVHHGTITILEPGETDPTTGRGTWPVHEVERNADYFSPDAGKLVKAGSRLTFLSIHLHANGAHTQARLDVGFKFHPLGYEPTQTTESIFFGNGVDLDIEGMEADQTAVSYFTLPEHLKVSIFEPHMHAVGVRMCLDAIWKHTVQTLNCTGYDHSWVRVYTYADDAAPLLPKGTTLRITGYFNNSPSNPNVPDPRNWTGGGQRSVDQMFINLMRGAYLTDEEFEEAMAKRREALNLKPGEMVIGCPLCGEEGALADVTGAQQE